jgi:hypothetical protein
MYKKRKKTRRYDNGGMTNDDDKFSRQDSTDVYDYRNLINFFDGLDPAKITEAAEILSRGDENIKYNKLFRKMKDIKELNEKMGDLGDFNPNKKAAGGMVDDDDFTRQDSVDVHNYRIAADILGQDPRRTIKSLLIDSVNPSNELRQKNQQLANLMRLSDSMGDLGDFMPVKGETTSPLPTSYASGGTVDNSNQPDSLTNYIKGNDKYRMGGVPNDDNFSDMGDNMKHGGMVNKSKSGNRDPFTNQYD